MLPQPSVLGSQSRRGKSTCDQPEIAEQAHSHTSFQDGAYQEREGYNTEGRLDDKTGFEGCIPLGPHLSISPEIPPVLNTGSTMAVQGPPFWPQQRSLLLHQAVEACSGYYEETGLPDNPVPRRHADHGKEYGEGKETSGHSNRVADKPGLHCEFEVPTQELEFLGFCLNSQDMTITLPQSKLRSLKKMATEMMGRQKTIVRELARLLGMMVASHPAVLPAPLYYRHLERAKTRAL